jgi:sulfoquinovosidase
MANFTCLAAARHALLERQSPYVTEAPAPQYITSQLRSLFLENKEYSTFDLRADNRVEVTVFSGVMTGRVLFGRTPLDLIEEYTAYAGRMRPLPAWVHEGVMVAVQGGTARANTLLTELLAANVPLSSLWIQDWSGTKVTTRGHQVLWNWQLSPDLYPRWDELVERLANHGARVCIYMNPFSSRAPCMRRPSAKGFSSGGAGQRSPTRTRRFEPACWT